MGNPKEATRPVREYLTALEEANPSDSPPKSISLTDPSSSWTAAHGPAYFAYCTNYLIDLEAGIIVDVEASSVSKTAEANATKLMVDRVEEKYDIKPKRLVGDTNYGTAPMLDWMVNGKGIAPHVPVWDKSEHNDGTLSRSDFQWNEAANEYICPEGHPLKSNWRPFKNPRIHITKAGQILYHSSKKDCDHCLM